MRGEPMKFRCLADWTGIAETELFPQTFKSYELATVRYPVVEVTATIKPFENGGGIFVTSIAGGETANSS